jgi:hypothetical protein
MATNKQYHPLMLVPIEYVQTFFRDNSLPFEEFVESRNYERGLPIWRELIGFIHFVAVSRWVDERHGPNYIEMDVFYEQSKEPKDWIDLHQAKVIRLIGQQSFC